MSTRGRRITGTRRTERHGREALRSVAPLSVLPDISPARGEISRYIGFRQSSTLQKWTERQNCQSPPLRGRCPAGQRGVLSLQHKQAGWRDP
ncbi:hypothetical protein MPL1032_80109 [Mesorhizobium plurifarium]|uniref:Uncharacterized protein n=1 Tax=Mesorhizobium plurifarium TaxID=69974 RepID=A0A0K2W7F5_MESPL|nr:hypothetical protein MPL1032_80109 [Mesorhizobium plurifarium]